MNLRLVHLHPFPPSSFFPPSPPFLLQYYFKKGHVLKTDQCSGLSDVHPLLRPPVCKLANIFIYIIAVCFKSPGIQFLKSGFLWMDSVWISVEQFWKYLCRFAISLCLYTFFYFCISSNPQFVLD